MLVVPGMATAGVRPCLSLRGWSRSLPTPHSPGRGSDPHPPPMGTPQEPRALLRVPSHDCAIKGQKGFGRVRHSSQAGSLWLSPFPELPNICKHPHSPRSLPARHTGAGVAQPMGCELGESSTRGCILEHLGRGREAPTAAYTPGGTILHAGFPGAVGGTGRDTAPARLREMKEQLRARGRLRACSPRRAAAPLPRLRLERMRAHTSAPARVFALLFRGCD